MLALRGFIIQPLSYIRTLLVLQGESEKMLNTTDDILSCIRIIVKNFFA